MQTRKREVILNHQMIVFYVQQQSKEINTKCNFHFYVHCVQIAHYSFSLSVCVFIRDCMNILHVDQSCFGDLDFFTISISFSHYRDLRIPGITLPLHPGQRSYFTGHVMTLTDCCVFVCMTLRAADGLVEYAQTNQDLSTLI